MDISNAQQPLNTFLQRLSATIPVDELIVFGSYLEGTADDNSDVDVLIVSDVFESYDEDERLRILDRAADGIDPVVEAWGFTEKELAQAGRLSTLGYARDHGVRLTLAG